MPVGSGHPGLGFQVENLVKKGLSAGTVEMGRDLVEKDEGSGARKLADQPCFGEHQAEQERLLLAGGAVAGRGIVGAVNHY